MVETPTLYSVLSAAPGSSHIHKMYSLLRGEDLIQVHAHAINIAMGRDLRRNVSYSAAMAIELAASGKRVLYLNTYGGHELMCAAFGNSITPETSIHYLDVPTGTWDIKTILPRLEGHDVLIINSFEYASLTRSLKERIARELLEMYQQTRITIVLFSHEMKRDIAARCASRGATGILAGQAESVSRIGEEWNIKPASPVAPRYTAEEWQEAKPVHEKQMLRTAALPKRFGGIRPNPSIEIAGDRGFSYHYGDFWCDPFHRGPMASYLGKDMAIMARTPLLHQYLLRHPDTHFMMGNTPTEAQLQDGTWIEPHATIESPTIPSLEGVSTSHLTPIPTI